MKDTEKIVDELIDWTTAALLQAGKILDAFTKPETGEDPHPDGVEYGSGQYRGPKADPPTFNVPRNHDVPYADHAFGTPQQALESLRNHVSDMESQQRADVSRLAAFTSQVEQLEGQISTLRHQLAISKDLEAEKRFEPGLTGVQYHLTNIARNVDGLDVIVHTANGEQKRMPMDQWLAWEKVG